MNTIEQLSAPVTPEVTTSGSGSTESLGREDFLAMLIAQLENQDPLDPQDATEFTAQLAQFSSLDQLISMRGSMDALAGVQTDAQSLAAAGLIGREALVRGAEFGIGEGESSLPTLFVEVETTTELMGATLRDANGQIVASTGPLGTVEPGRTAIDWSDFTQIPGPGAYTLSVTPAPGAANPALLVQARVTGASLTDGSPVILMQGAQASLSSLVEVRE